MDVSELKSLLDGIRATTEGFGTRMSDMQRQLDAVDANTKGGNGRSGSFETKSLAEEIFENAEFKHLGEMGGRGRVTIKIENFQKKALTNTAVGAQTTGVLSIDREPGLLPIQFRQLRIRDLLRSKPTTSAVVDYVKVNTFTNLASMQVEASDKAQSDMTLSSVSVPIQVIAHWIPVSKQCFSDVEGLQEAINTHLLYGLKLKEETQLLLGTGTGLDLNGLVTQATSFNTALLGSSYNRLDNLARAMQQAERSEYTPDLVVLHTDDFWSMALTKSTQGEYLFGDPGAANVPRIWGRPIAVTNTIATGTFLVGSSQTALIRDRMEAIVEISDSHSDYWIKNMLAIRCECREALQVMRPAAWIFGTFATSPAS